ncbi:MAG: hypothetical protein LBR94_06680, partial [Desulfovibrio sp.]|nr:hypothetical protein [Desulfovibrio sp.]
LAQFIHGDNRETKAALIISSIIGIALTSSLIFDKNAPYVSDKDYIRKYFTGAFEALFGEETDKRHGQDQER